MSTSEISASEKSITNMSSSEISALQTPVSGRAISGRPISETTVSGQEIDAELISISCRESAPIREIFCSVQGEGPYVGARQAFVRFSGCNLKCKYCDTNFSNPGTCDYEKGEGSGSFEKVPNPISSRKLKDMLQPFKNLHSVSLTGGEPLLHANFIEELARAGLSAPLYLESNMTLPEQARKVKDRVAYVAGDFKLPEALGLESPQSREARKARENHIENTVECFKTLRKSKTRDCFCKIVISRDSDPASVVSAVDAIADYVSCVILQPETGIANPEAGTNTQPLATQTSVTQPSATQTTVTQPSVTQPSEMQSSVRTLIELQSILLEKIDTRIIPQTHRMWGCL